MSEKMYACREENCFVLRTKAEGGTTFSYCEEHMPVTPEQPDTTRGGGEKGDEPSGESGDPRDRVVRREGEAVADVATDSSGSPTQLEGVAERFCRCGCHFNPAMVHALPCCAHTGVQYVLPHGRRPFPVAEQLSTPVSGDIVERLRDDADCLHGPRVGEACPVCLMLKEAADEIARLQSQNVEWSEHVTRVESINEEQAARLRALPETDSGERDVDAIEVWTCAGCLEKDADTVLRPLCLECCERGGYDFPAAPRTGASQ